MIYLFLAEGFEEIEALATADILRRAGCELQLVGVGGTVITGVHGIAVTADLTEENVATQGLEMVILPGGMPGAKNLENSAVVERCVRYCLAENKRIAAICAAPSILGHWGILQGHNATCFPGYEQELTGAKIFSDPVCVSGNIITGKGAGATTLFALSLVTVLFDEEKANSLACAMQCPGYC